jgi:hypothetical protein
MTLMARGPFTWGTGGSAGFAGGSGAFSVGYGEGAGAAAAESTAEGDAGSGAGVVATLGAQAAIATLAASAVRPEILVVIIACRSSLMRR